MKNILTILLVISQLVVYGQSDSLKIYRPFGPDFSKTIYLVKEDGLTYDNYLGENIAGSTIAEGWRLDTISGGLNKKVGNPYVKNITFAKQSYDKNLRFYRYKGGKLFTGAVIDTLTVTFTPSKIVGYLYGKPYYESKDLTVIFRANCVNGLLQGRGVLCGLVPQYGIYNNLPLSECNFEDGEIIGLCKEWNLNTVNFNIQDGKIKVLEDGYDYFELRKLLELTEITYVKGTSDYVKYITFKRDQKTGEIKPIAQKISAKTTIH